MSEPDLITRNFFNRDTVTVERPPGLLEGFDDDALIALSGAPSDSIVKVAHWEKSAVALIVETEIVHVMRRLLMQSNGDFYIRNDSIRIKSGYQGKNLAARSVALQARAAQELGFKYIVLDAIGDCQLAASRFAEDRWIGYWLWPQLGFLAEIPSHVRPKLSPQFQGFKSVAELIASAEGLAEWKLWGDELKDATFDLTADSKSWQLLSDYLRSKSIKV